MDKFDIHKQIDYCKLIFWIVSIFVCIWLWLKVFIALIKFF